MGPLTEAQVKQWKESGYAVVPGLLEPSLVDACATHVNQLFQDNPSPDFGSDGKCEFPTGTKLDDVTLHETLIDAVCQLLDTKHIVLTQSDAWCKAGKTDFTDNSNNDQRFHMDYGNNTWLHPAPWHRPENVAAIVYLADTGVTGGGTAVCKRESDNDELYQEPYINMPGLGGFSFYNNRKSAEQYFQEKHPEVAALRQKLYDREVIPVYRRGDVLLYRYDVWHRGTPVKPGHRRSVINLAWSARAAAEWNLCWNPAWTKWNYYGKGEGVLTRISPKQRALIGVPEPGHECWTEQRVRGFGARYPGLDVQPYLDKIKTT